LFRLEVTDKVHVQVRVQGFLHVIHGFHG
jgi:hypothetical protein